MVGYNFLFVFGWLERITAICFPGTFWPTKKQFSGYAAKKGIPNFPFNQIT